MIPMHLKISRSHCFEMYHQWNSNDRNFLNEKTLQCLKNMEMKCGGSLPLKGNDELVRELLMPNEKN